MAIRIKETKKKMTKKERYNYVIDWFSKNMPNAETELHYTTHFELLVAVMLSAQCTDKRVNMVTPALFAAYPDAVHMSKAEVSELFRYIRSISYPNSKAIHLSEMSHQLVEQFGGDVPSDMDQLQSLPGVGRKTANVVRAVAFDIPSMPVDTHVFRVANRIGLSTNATTPLEVEKQLCKGFPKALLSRAHHWLILHGRYVCMARTPKCDSCGIKAACKYYVQLSKKKA